MLRALSGCRGSLLPVHLRPVTQVRTTATMNKSQLEELATGASQLQPLASRFDFDPATQANGVRSFANIVTRFLEMTATPPSDSKKAADFAVVANTLSRVLKLMQAAVRREGDFASLTPVDTSVLSRSFAFKRSDVEPFNGSVGPFWLKDYFRGEGRITVESARDLIGRMIENAAKG